MTKPQNLRENKMGVMPINKLLISMSLPMMISMLVQALYNIVDSIFVAQIGENALASVSLVFPLQMLMISVGMGTGVGINALLSKSLGEKNFDRANKTADNGIFLALLSFIVFCIIGLFFSRIYMSFQTNISEIVDYGTSYLTIICCFSFGIFGQVTFERLLQSTGKTFYTMITQGTGAIINIILDPILIFGLLGFPAMGVAGAALATVIGQVIAASLAIYFNLTKNDEIHISFKKFRPSGQIIKRIYYVGVPSTIMAAIGSVMTFGMNLILISFTPTATAVFGVYFRIQSFVFMPVMGLNNGMIPIVAYNYGARNKDRMNQTIKLSIIYAVAIMLTGLAVIQIFPSQILSVFNASQAMLEIGIPALRIISLSFTFAGFCIIISSVLQALGNGILSMFISIARQLIVLLPSAFILAKVFGLNAVWWSFPISEIASLILCIIFMKYMNEKVINTLEPSID